MEPLDDKELEQLLRRWEAAPAPRNLKCPIPTSRQSLWRAGMQWFWNGRIHVPVPAGAALIVIAAATWIYFAKPPATARPPVGNAIAQPSTPAVSPAVSPATPAATPPVEQVAPAASNVDRAETAALSGFRPVIQLEPKIIREHQ
jgi:hypothetical protein